MHNVYSSLHTIIKEQSHMHSQLMVLAQSAGYQGLKREHERLAKCFYKYSLKIAKESFDRYQIPINIVPNGTKCVVGSLKEHFVTWDTSIMTAQKILSELNKQHTMLSGVSSKHIDTIVCKLFKQHEKVRRWLVRFEATSWSSHDIYVWDKHIHTKNKERCKHG